jgi:tetratricopeptide (TPR) repeat protein
MAAMLKRPLPPSLATSVLLRLASQDSAAGNHDKELRELFNAYRIAPKTSERDVLSMLSTCYRSLRDTHAAVCFQALAVASEAQGTLAQASDLYDMAIMQKDDGHIDQALNTIERALQINAESWNLRVLKAGYLAQSGQREEGMALFATIQPPRVDTEFYDCMHAWFLCVTKQEAAFFEQLKAALDRANSLWVITWIDQDTDLAAYRHDPRFVAITEAYRRRVVGASAAGSPPATAASTR